MILPGTTAKGDWELMFAPPSSVVLAPSLSSLRRRFILSIWMHSAGIPLKMFSFYCVDSKQLFFNMYSVAVSNLSSSNSKTQLSLKNRNFESKMPQSHSGQSAPCQSWELLCRTPKTQRERGSRLSSAPGSSGLAAPCVRSSSWLPSRLCQSWPI